MTHQTLLHRVLAISVLALGLFASATDAQSADEQAAEPAIRTLYLVRHGAYNRTSDAEDYTGNALIPLGIAQARLAGARLASLPVEFSAIHSSTMTRARQSAEVIPEDFPNLEVRQSPLIAECTPTTRRQDIMQDMEEGEAAACEKQLDEAFAAYFKPSYDGPKHEVLVCHGNAIRYLVTKILGVDTHAWLGMGIGHASITVVQVKPDGALKLLSYGDVGHIAPNIQTGYGGLSRKLTVPGPVGNQ